MPHLAWFLAFKAVAERQSFTLASRDLHLTQPAVSQQVAKLEALLKTKLFFRSPRKVELTEDGQRLYRKIELPFNALLNIVDDFHEHSDNYILNIESEPVFSRIVITKQLPHYLKHHQHVRVRQVLTTHHLDFLPETELAIKWGQGHWPGFDAKFLYGLHYVPVCSPKYQADLGLVDPEDLTRATFIHERDGSDWQYWLKHYPVIGLDTLSGHVAGESDVVTAMAMEGLGVALCGYELVREHLEQGALVMPFPELKVLHHKAYYILTRQEQPISREALDFIRSLDEVILNIHSEFRQGESL